MGEETVRLYLASSPDFSTFIHHELANFCYRNFA